ncbi:MAG: hypothetical protein IJL69_03600 [Oscillospiraceae bacterium]|jgi:hypothetical protein|nr:hypothetical protein [Oscillospiraceae bacterium]
MKIFKNRAFAIAFCAVVCIGALLLGARRSMVRRYNKVAKEYSGGLEVLLEEKAGLASNFLVLARRYPGADAALTAELEASVAALRGAEGPASAYAASTRLDTAVTALYYELDELELSERDEGLLASNLDNLKAKNIQIGYSEYNDTARRYNDKVSGPVSGFLRRAVGVRLAELFS